MSSIMSLPMRRSLLPLLFAATAIVSLPASPVFAQAATVPSPALDAETAARLDAQRQLTEALSRIAADGSDWFALSQAGRAALALGDARAATGFLARAEALAPQDPVIKAALGAAMVQLEDPEAAMRYFDAAVAAGGLDRTYIGDRGLAFDLLGDQRRAQADYAVADREAPSAEVTRRHAISLGISGYADRAVQMLGPLLRAQDRAAWRSRAMIVAMNGRPDEARQIARTTMPVELAQAIEPYWMLLDRLTPAQLAAASHFGRFPDYAEVERQPSRSAVRLAAATPPVAVPQLTPDRARSERARERGTRGRRTEAARSPVPSPAAASTAAPALASITAANTTASTAATAAAATSAAPPVTAAPPPPPPAPALVSAPVVQPVAAATVPALPAATAAPAPLVPVPVAPPTGSTVLAGWSMASVIESITVPESERAASADALSLSELQAIAAEQRRAQAEAAAAARASAQEQARTRAAEQAEARRRAAEEAEAREEAARLRNNPARIWVQVATGANVSALAFDCRRLARERAAAWGDQNCSSAEWGRTRRLVVGPFRNQAAARAWESAYRRAGGDAFIWMSDAGEEVTPVGRR
jgi:tetratricopeptide (TPR) repeat protein